MTLSRKPKSHELISPTGAGIVLICFFLPWLKVSCGAKKMTLAGSDLGGIFYAIPVAATIMLITFLIFLYLGKTHRSRLILFGGSLAAILIVAYKAISIALNPQIPFFIPSKMIGFELKMGAIGTILGLLLSFGGALYNLRFYRKTNKTEVDDGG